MKRSRLLLLVTLMLALPVMKIKSETYDEERFDVTLLSGKTFKNCKILRTEPDGIVVLHSAGVGKFIFSELPSDLRKKHEVSQKEIEQETLKQARREEPVEDQDRTRSIVEPDKTVKAEVGKGSPVEGQNWISPATGMEFVWIEPMDMWVGKYEVTNEEYRKKEPGHDSKSYKNHSLNDDRQPVVYVDFDDAKAYAEWMTQQDQTVLGGSRYRLPSEQEWMTYAQCGDRREYPWGNEWPPPSGRAGNYADESAKRAFTGWIIISEYDDGFPVAAPVDQLWLNPWGLYGVGGNVWEICAKDNIGASFGALRGAFWNSVTKEFLRCSYRFDIDGTARYYNGGFRMVAKEVGKHDPVGETSSEAPTQNNTSTSSEVNYADNGSSKRIPPQTNEDTIYSIFLPEDRHHEWPLPIRQVKMAFSLTILKRAKIQQANAIKMSKEDLIWMNYWRQPRHVRGDVYEVQLVTFNKYDIFQEPEFNFYTFLVNEKTGVVNAKDEKSEEFIKLLRSVFY